MSNEYCDAFLKAMVLSQKPKAIRRIEQSTALAERLAAVAASGFYGVTADQAVAACGPGTNQERVRQVYWEGANGRGGRKNLSRGKILAMGRTAIRRRFIDARRRESRAAQKVALDEVQLVAPDPEIEQDAIGPVLTAAADIERQCIQAIVDQSPMMAELLEPADTACLRTQSRCRHREICATLDRLWQGAAGAYTAYKSGKEVAAMPAVVRKEFVLLEGLSAAPGIDGLLQTATVVLVLHQLQRDGLPLFIGAFLRQRCEDLAAHGLFTEASLAFCGDLVRLEVLMTRFYRRAPKVQHDPRRWLHALLFDA